MDWLKAVGIAVASAAATYLAWFVVEEAVRRARDGGAADVLEIRARAAFDDLRRAWALEHDVRKLTPHVLFDAWDATREAAGEAT